MLRIERHYSGMNRTVLWLEGRLIAEWADLLEQECVDLIHGGYRVMLDLSLVEYIGHQGTDALRRLAGVGVAIRGCTALIADLLEEEGIRVTRNSEDMNDRQMPSVGRNGSDA